MFFIMKSKLLWQPLILIGCFLCRWVSGKQWFTGRRRTNWLWQNRPVSTWTLICHLALPQEPLCFKAVPTLRKQHYSTRPTTETSTESCKRQSSEDKCLFCFISFETEMHCQGRPQKAIGIVVNIPPGHSPSSFSFLQVLYRFCLYFPLTTSNLST